MTLLEIRTQLVDSSGRNDLVVDTTSYVDNGANFFIRAGSRTLDSLQDTPKSVATLQKDIAAGDYKVVFEQNRTIERVWVTDGSTVTDEGRSEVTKVTRDWLKGEYPTPIANIDQDRPAYYIPAIIGLAPEQSALTASNFTGDFTYDWEEITFSDAHWDKTGILFLPPADIVYTVIVKGKWWSRSLTADGNQNFWSVNHPELLVNATLLELEKVRRNTQGVNDMRGALVEQLRGIDIDLSANDIAEVDFLSEVMETRL